MNPELQAKYNSLPEDVKKAIDSSDVPLKLQAIGKRHNLQIDKIGILEGEVAAVMLGINHPDNLVDTIESALEVSTAEAMAITVEINTEIFLSIRQSLMSMHEAAETSAEESAAPTPAPTPASSPIPSKPAVEEPMSSREDILAGIENPEPAIHPISAVDQTIPGPAMRAEITPADKAAATSFIAGKLTETMTQPPQKAVFEEKKVPEKPKTYTADPYREPIM